VGPSRAPTRPRASPSLLDVRWTSLLAAVVVALAGAFALPAAAPAKALVGLAADVDGTGAPPRDEAERIAATGARMVREDFGWDVVESRRGVYDWTLPDAIVEAAAAAGRRVLPILDGTPCWAAPPETPPAECKDTVAALPDDYARYAAAAAARYGPGGAFWAGHPGLDPNLAPTVFELYNEPYFGRPDPARYAVVARAAADAGRAANPRTHWLAAATVAAPTADGAWLDWAGGMVTAAPDLARRVDGLAVHVYPGPNPPEVGLRFVADVQAAYARRGVALPVWVTEAGYPACGDPPDPARCVPGATRPEREAVKADRLGRLLTGLRDAPGVEAVFAYTLREWDDPFYGSFGMVDTAGRPLPALDAFRDVAGPVGPPPVWAWPGGMFP